MSDKTLARRRSAVEWAESITSAIAVILLVFVFVVQPANVDGSSMLPTLTNGDKILLRSAFYTPEKGDIIVIDSYNRYGETLVKRVIATGGDTVDINYSIGEVRVNGELLDEPYILAPTTVGEVSFPITVPQGQLFVMGDNRPNSRDSRYDSIGLIDERDVMGKVFFRITPQMGRVD